MAPEDMPQERADKRPEPADFQVVRKNVAFALSFLDRAAREASERGVVVESIESARARLEDVVTELQIGEHFGAGK